MDFKVLNLNQSVFKLFILKFNKNWLFLIPNFKLYDCKFVFDDSCQIGHKCYYDKVLIFPLLLSAG